MSVGQTVQCGVTRAWEAGCTERERERERERKRERERVLGWRQETPLQAESGDLGFGRLLSSESEGGAS